MDILVVNAGGSDTRPGPLEEIDEVGWRALVEGNHGHFPDHQKRAAGHEAAQSRQHHHSVLGRGSEAASHVPGAIAAAKARIQMMTQHLAVQVGPFGIRVNCIAPETILTERNQQRIPEAQVQPLIEQHPIRRLGEPEDVAMAALFLASEQSAWITGLVLDVAGGAVMV